MPICSFNQASLLEAVLTGISAPSFVPSTVGCTAPCRRSNYRCWWQGGTAKGLGVSLSEQTKVLHAKLNREWGCWVAGEDIGAPREISDDDARPTHCEEPAIGPCCKGKAQFRRDCGLIFLPIFWIPPVDEKPFDVRGHSAMPIRNLPKQPHANDHRRFTMC